MDKAYDPKSAEQATYKKWEDGGYFTPKVDSTKKPFTILLPPPNANADLHVGHAMYVVEDILVRYHRMKGDPTLWLPGADHAGFETQFVYEKHLAKEGKSRFDFDRDTLYKNIWDFVHNNRSTMENQLRRLGFSLDWSRNTFTLDPKIVDTVYKTFKKLYDDGLVYRGAKLVNYCTKCGTGFSDLEVKHEESVGKLYYIKYKIANESGEITVATTRPETMFGDEAVAVHPSDKRYQKYIGKQVLIPITNRSIPVISDTVVKKGFGTGAVKITPAHDENDFETGKRHNLHITQVIGFNGKMMAVDEVPNKYVNLSVSNAREAIIQELSRPEIGLIDHIDDHHKMVKGSCYKCGRTIEPLPLSQWFVKIKPLAEKAIEAIKAKEITFVPKRFEKLAIRWLTDFHDWNISRQIVWGIQIPVWYCLDCNADNVFLSLKAPLHDNTISADWNYFKSRLDIYNIKSYDDLKSNVKSIKITENARPIVDTKTPSHCSACNSKNIIRDEDTFDTWFSSGQWPFATLVASSVKGKGISETQLTPDLSPSPDYDYFYPTSVMETGYDILPWWVCRMTMLGLYMTGNVPFKTVYLHGLVRDGKGQKMSKSKGNVINPLKMIDLYGTDALRFALIFGTAAGNDQALSEDKIRGMRNFANKLWNIGRFIEMNTPEGTQIERYSKTLHGALTNSHDKRIITELNMLTAKVTKNLELYRLSDAAKSIYDFAWHRLADVHLEKNKDRFKMADPHALAVLLHVYKTILKLAHPFIPFVTETIYQQLPGWDQNPLIVTTWPGNTNNSN